MLNMLKIIIKKILKFGSNDFKHAFIAEFVSSIFKNTGTLSLICDISSEFESSNNNFANFLLSLL
jgi:hypothetical protein